MEDDNGLELSLGLSFGGSSVKSKSKNGSSLDIRAEEVGTGGKMGDFKDFLNGGNQGTDPSKPGQNFFSDLSKAREDDASVSLNGKGLWFADNKKLGEIEEDKRLETGNKRKMFFDEMNNQKKHEIEVHHDDLHGRARTQHNSVTEHCSNAEHESVADSEAENPTSRPFSLNDKDSKQFLGVSGSSDAPKEGCKVSDSSATDFNGQKRFIGLSEKDFKLASLTYGASFPVQQVNLMNMPYPSPVKESNSVGAPSPQIPGMVHAMPVASSGAQPTSNGNLPVMFQLPISDKDNSQGLVFYPQQSHPSFAGRSPQNSAAKHVIPNNLSEVMPIEGRPLERTNGDGNRHFTLPNTSQAEDVKGSSSNLREKNVSDQPTKENFSIDCSAIKPGLAADVKFGGSGSLPILPWVSATGSNGRTISGVTYRYSNNQIRIVCACHGCHMSPDDFVRHANEDTANPEGGAVSGKVGNGNPSASAQS